MRKKQFIGRKRKLLALEENAENKAEHWKENTYYKVGDTVLYNSIAYKCLQAHKSIITWKPDVALTLWSPTNSGDKPNNGVDVPDDDKGNVQFNISSDWGTGLNANVIIKNSGQDDIEDWQLKFKLDESAQISSLWNGNYQRDGQEITVTHAGWNKIIKPGQSVNFGMSISHTGQFNEPKQFTLNGKEIDGPEDGNGGNNGQQNEYGSAIVTIDQPSFDNNLFTPKVTIDGESKSISFGENAEFKVKAGKTQYVSADSFTIGDKVYRPEISEYSFLLQNDENKHITVQYKESNVGDVNNYYVGYFQSWSDKWASSGKDTHLANLPKYVNVVMLAFAKPDINYNGNLELKGTGLEFSYNGQVLKEAIEHLKRSNPDTKVIISIGGLTYTNWANINFEGIEKFIKDFGLDGVDIDYEPAGGFNTGYDTSGQITYDKEGEYVNIIREMRKVLPRPYILCATGWSVGAYGEDQWKSAKPGPFASTGMMLPIFRKAGEQLDMVNVMRYNAGEYDPIDALKAYKHYYNGPVNIGIMVPPEDWGGHVWTLDKVAKTARYINQSNVGGMMIWSLQRTHENPNNANPDGQMISTLIAQELNLPEADESLFPLSNPTYTPPWGEKYPVEDDVDNGDNNNGENNNTDRKWTTMQGLVVEGTNYNDTDSIFTTDFVVKNPNSTYKWDSGIYNVWGFSFETSSKVKNVQGAKSFSQSGNAVTVLLNDWETNIPLGESRKVTITFDKKRESVYPDKLKVQFMRGDDIYPDRPSLPSSFTKGKADLAQEDLIKNPTEYYRSQAEAISDGLMLYNSPSDTQINIGLADDVYTNLTGRIKMWVPSRYMAMALGYIQEIYGINPNYMAALGTKENFSFGVYPRTEGAFRSPVEINGETWYWGMTSGSKDGPFQQETPNFNEVKDSFTDSFPEKAQHDNYTFVSESINDPKFIKAAISSAASLTMTREFMYAVPSYQFKDFVQNAKDHSAEDVLLTYAYNRGLYSVDGKVFRDNMEGNLNSSNLVETLGYNGFADHVPQVLGILEKMNKETSDIYDIKLTKDDVNVFLKELRSFYPHGVPSEEEWAAMSKDVNRAFDVLSKHWKDDKISFRYDFLTIVRVIKTHLPSSIPPSPKGENFGYQVINRNK